MYIQIILIGLILSIDTFSVAVAMGSRPFLKKDAFKFALASGSVATFLTMLGAVAGENLAKQFNSYGHLVALSLLMVIAIHMTFEGISELKSNEDEKKLEFHNFGKILLVTFATSIDAFGVGVGFGMYDKPMIPYLFSIGIFGFISTIAGLYLAKKVSKKAGPVFTIIGAIILMLIAFKMLKI